MYRTNSLQQFIPVKNCERRTFLSKARSLPNIDLIQPPKRQVQIKRQSSRRGKLFQKTWDKVKTIIHPSVRRNSKPKPSLECLPNIPRNTSPTPKIIKYQLVSSSAPTTPIKILGFDFEEQEVNHAPNPNIEEDQVVRNYEKLQKRLSDELHQSIKEERKKEEALSDDFKKRLQQWDMWKASTGKYRYTEDELQKLIPSDFSKKLQEWEIMKTRSRELVQPLSFTQVDKAPRKRKSTDHDCRQKELAWLEKQLEKIELEKKRLEIEMKKYCERESRLQKLREVLKNSPDPKQEVWIKTPTAECKVEGINEKFAKKLFKWEEKQGIEPESSTMALLNPKYFFHYPEFSNDSEVNGITNMVSDPDDDAKPGYTSSDENDSEADGEFEETAEPDSFTTKDGGASGASNTDSECFNLKPGFRRRSSDALSTPLSLSARSASLSACTSDDEENVILKSVNETEEVKPEEKQVLKAEPILVGANDIDEGDGFSSIIVQTKRTIFAPVLADSIDFQRNCDNKVVLIQNKEPVPHLIKNIPNPHCYTSGGHAVWKKIEQPPRVVGVVRKGSSYDLPGLPPRLNSNSAASQKDIRPNFPKMGGKIPVWCSPLMARRNYQYQEYTDSRFTQSTDFTIDKFLQQSNLVTDVTSKHSRIPITSSGVKRKYTIGGGVPPRRQEIEPVRLLSLTRSSSFQGSRPIPDVHLEPILQDQISPQLVVTKSKSTGSMLGTSGVSKGLFSLASRLGLMSDQKSKVIPAWLSRSSSSSAQHFKKS